jgi:N6-L-threonylcarbamoyladenine synthase
VVEVLVEKSVKAIKELGITQFALAGGVASNQCLREKMQAACEEVGAVCYYPSPIYCTDNAAMIGVAAYHEYQNGTRHGLDLNAVPNLKLGQRVTQTT